eukprot:TRINITY_DN2324_c0_g1_i1.p2 TRINITY_DN2324_c0_g1~~TRINITY_DN2324_c0_g1_i1.p2  ORF type:complete len:110 (-),score=30.17 TRINITY_DN2324_c0_g1_i1:112-441(-)
MNDSTTNITPSYNIVVLDGTWTQVKRMGKRLPELKYIRLEKVKETISRMRKQSSKDRVTTYEAIALLLEEMEEEETKINELWEVFRVKLDESDKQSGREKGKPPVQRKL